ncbi:MAG: tRNA uridine(34) 5-carboxymethylaminomethyl modification radical SAM/GNAT enzyme Elp3 [Candidatus Altiarchaeota archaeon]|nr:tRNA uridine(34) 5-carboxymethylaminomethyl modification radical SAM/GNAT enzyme Elp3 [Candidatus Altiarchaeota archaeon]
MAKQIKPMRTLSGVSVIAVMAPAHECPGECSYCFKGPDAAVSYTGKEPAASRAIQLNYDPYKITRQRIEQLEKNGHPVDKIELIIMGGTFNAFPRKFQENFVLRIFEACNLEVSQNLQEAFKKNENAKHRIIGITFETRPDWAGTEELEWLLSLGATRIELGVQSVFDSVLKRVNRGHDVNATITATKLAKDLGYKVGYHIMPGLPGSSEKKDLEMFQKLFTDAKFMPDMLKIYPTLVIKGSRLETWVKEGKYDPFTTEQAVHLLSRAKTLIPPWARIMRVQRDVPVPEVEAGLDKGNLRQMIWQEMDAQGTKCQCIRCREVKGEVPSNLRPKLMERRYEASGATEVFLSYEDPTANKMAAFLRLRLLKQAPHPVLREETAIVREIRVYGPEARFGEKGIWQHRGIGKDLMRWAENITKKEGYKKLAVISGVGVRKYFRKLGYDLAEPYMIKNLEGQA